MRRLIILVATSLSMFLPAASAHAGQSTAPTAACNGGTMLAHESVPEMTGAGASIEAHEHIPGSVDGACLHEAFG